MVSGIVCIVENIGKWQRVIPCESNIYRYIAMRIQIFFLIKTRHFFQSLYKRIDSILYKLDGSMTVFISAWEDIAV